MSKPILVSLSSDLTNFEVADLKHTLQTHFAGNHTVKLDLTHAGKIDASGLQLIVAAHRSGQLILHGLSASLVEDCRRIGWDPSEQGIL